jgi:hypothetical protein
MDWKGSLNKGQFHHSASWLFTPRVACFMVDILVALALAPAVRSKTSPVAWSVSGAM